jgi:hypothetical protein
MVHCTWPGYHALLRHSSRSPSAFPPIEPGIHRHRDRGASTRPREDRTGSSILCSQPDIMPCFATLHGARVHSLRSSPASIACTVHRLVLVKIAQAHRSCAATATRDHPSLRNPPKNVRPLHLPIVNPPSFFFSHSFFFFSPLTKHVHRIAKHKKKGVIHPTTFSDMKSTSPNANPDRTLNRGPRRAGRRIHEPAVGQAVIVCLGVSR